MKKLRLILYALFLAIGFATPVMEIPTSPKAEKCIASVEPALKKELKALGLEYGAPLFIRIFKDPGVLEVWLESEEGVFINFKNYKIAALSGGLGPKLKEGDKQGPEGFYFVNAKRLNPWSRYHLSFNIGYPNEYDRFHGRTGNALMVHGKRISIGCYAMTDPYMNEIYALAVAALKSGQPFFRVHSFPFKLESEALEKYKERSWYSFWVNLKEGYDYFNQHKKPPSVEVLKGKYIFTP